MQPCAWVGLSIVLPQRRCSPVQLPTIPAEGLDRLLNGGKLDCLDAIELHLLRPAVAELQDAHELASADLSG